MNREDIFKLIQSKAWVPLIEKLKSNDVYNAIQADGIAKKVMQDNFLSELIHGNSFKDDAAYPHYLSQFHILHKVDKYNFKFSDEDYEKLIQKLVEENHKSGRLTEAYNYAIEFPKNITCERVISEYLKQQSLVVSHPLEEKINIKSNDYDPTIDNTISLFKSQQEYLFYRAVREVFQAYMVFPNVALSSTIDFEAIKDELNLKEQGYFFKALVDSVVIDQENDYKPLKFVELDSAYHDNPRQKQNDLIKDKIIGLAGHKLFRIRSKSKAITEKEFIVILREAIK